MNNNYHSLQMLPMSVTAHSIKREMMVPKKQGDFNFEKALQELEDLVEKMESGNLSLEAVSERHDEVGDLMRNADIVNLAGPKAVALGLQEEVITQDHVITIAGIPHAQAVISHD